MRQRRQSIVGSGNMRQSIVGSGTPSRGVRFRDDSSESDSVIINELYGEPTRPPGNNPPRNNPPRNNYPQVADQNQNNGQQMSHQLPDGGSYSQMAPPNQTNNYGERISHHPPSTHHAMANRGDLSTANQLRGESTRQPMADQSNNHGQRMSHQPPAAHHPPTSRANQFGQTGPPYYQPYYQPSANPSWNEYGYPQPQMHPQFNQEGNNALNRSIRNPSTNNHWYEPPTEGPNTPQYQYQMATSPPVAPKQEEMSESVVTMLRNIETKPVVLFVEDSSKGSGQSRVVKMILSNLGVNAETDMVIYNLDVRSDGPKLASKLTQMTGYDSQPILYINGKCFGDYHAILARCKNDELRPKLTDAGIKGVVSAIPVTTLESNIFGYPKALGMGQREQDAGATTMNLLVACCGSSASDKIPELIDKCVRNNWSVKLVCTSSGEHFFKSFGMERVINAIGSENIYRDEDEWSFEYEKFDMPVRACHLAIRKWADVLVVAPMTCNTMAKAAAGIGDNLLSSILVAWEYHKKPVFACPACNVDMWNNFPTQRNVKTLKQIGINILGPRVDRLTNGDIAIGCMERIDTIIARLKTEESTMLSGSGFFFSRAKQAALEDNDELWELVLRGVEEKVIDVNEQMEDNGNTLLHLAAGGESFAEDGVLKWGQPDLFPLKKLIELGADVNIFNKHQYKPLHVAISAGDMEAIQILLDAGADTTATLINFPKVSQKIRDVLATKEEASNLVTPYYFTYGSLKRGFPNYDNLAHHLKEFVGAAKTVQKFPLVVPNDPSCTNPNCPYLHQQATLCNYPGKGLQVTGEVFVVTSQDIEEFDRLEGFGGGDHLDNVYSRQLVDVDVEGKGVVKAYVYFHSHGIHAMEMVKDGTAEFVEEYVLSMARGDLKPGFEEPKVQKKIEHEASMRSLSRRFGSSTLPSNRKARRSSLVTSSENEPLSSLQEIPKSESNERSDYSSSSMRNMRRSTVYSNSVHENVGTMQQAINTCNLAAITMALKSLGVNCPMDEIFSALRLPTSWVVENGLTLAQVYNIFSKLCGSQDPSEALAPGFKVECYHMDDTFADFKCFTRFLKESLGGRKEVIIVNFSTRIARDMEQGGGHFSLIAGYKESVGRITIADVHPQKYGAQWTCSARQLFDAMVDKDGSVKRARGMIRISFQKTGSIDCMDNCGQAISFFNQKYSEKMRDWLARWGDLPVNSFESHLNMGGLNSVGLALSGFLSRDDFDSLKLPNYVSADYLAWNLRLSVVNLLSEVTSPSTLENYAHRACDKLHLDLKCNALSADTRSPEKLLTWLKSRVGPSHYAVALALLDLNEAYGTNIISVAAGSEASVFDHGAQHWCCIVATGDDNEVIIADPRAKMMTRLWKCSVSNLRQGLLRAEKDPGQVIIVGNR